VLANFDLPLTGQIQYEPSALLSFLTLSEELELCDCGCIAPHLPNKKKRFSGKKNANVHRKFTIRMTYATTFRTT